MPPKPQINKIKRIILPILKENNVVKAGIFGSYARGEQKRKSDLDILIKYGRKQKSLLDLVHLKHQLEDRLKVKVDLLTYQSVNPLFREEIFKDEVRIL
ncbi:nucleotidyltransferase family protein [Candidatus Woesearchaeota archaeon]|nr:nucleotidyltransferase family protein [Candidatus Woesearchaeota archaeon]